MSRRYPWSSPAPKSATMRPGRDGAGLGFKVRGLGVWGLGFGVSGLGIRVFGVRGLKCLRTPKP